MLFQNQPHTNQLEQSVVTFLRSIIQYFNRLISNYKKRMKNVEMFESLRRPLQARKVLSDDLVGRPVCHVLNEFQAMSKVANCL